jgi:hypothetical protein
MREGSTWLQSGGCGRARGWSYAKHALIVEREGLSDVHKGRGEDHLHVSVDERVHARSCLNDALSDALVINILEIVLECSQHGRGTVLLCIRWPCGRSKSLGQEVGSPSLDVNALIVCTVTNDGKHAGYDGRIVSTVA